MEHWRCKFQTSLRWPTCNVSADSSLLFSIGYLFILTIHLLPLKYLLLSMLLLCTSSTSSYAIADSVCYQEIDDDDEDDDSSDEDEPVPQPQVDKSTIPGYGDLTYNQDLSDSDMSDGISEDENGVPRFYDPNAPNPNTLHPFSHSAKYRIMPPRGIVTNQDGSPFDWDSCMTFPDPPDPATLNRKVSDKVKRMEQKMTSHRQVLMSFSDNTSTPEMNWALCTNRAAVNAQAATRATGEFLDRGLGASNTGLATGSDNVIVAYKAKKDREKLEAKEKKRKAALNPQKKKKASRQPKYQKRKYTWKDSTRKNKGKLYDSRKEGEAEEGDDE